MAIPAGELPMGAFRMDACAVTNADFERFTAETGYRTGAERAGWSFVFAGLLPHEFPPTRAVAGAPWWRQVEGADWRHPDGPHSTWTDRADHPVVHVDWHDATAYCSWAGRRLPTEVEWERAARGGLHGTVFPWGDEREPGGRHRMNVWQGAFPSRNTQADGWYGTCPVTAFEPNGFGLYNMTGNVWEWCEDPFSPHGEQQRGDQQHGVPERVTKGGSYLCHESYCRRYTIAARQGLTPDSTTGNVGFRCVLDGTGEARPI
ncbi:MAG TPA: formylglycine-generating enzyme family protein [Pseudonocardia sp.]|nr:formylglycine-generating enzyme family protein [Pseudonocardia sp.]